ncbi:MAG: Citronellyl-CoA dehydrogenase @ Acyl-CoA dehydrogenase, Mycobacterial subgroup FadE13 [uncultured Actinomycetospora sp.]|uniref:Citronellyl-CoA dehydrogenase @ Acyl-CoA dehydrogenase, Mycobacterial subgroup FadE13 n=1 Tax=uncultured Actinomycetospora sp. TaxID=1135996 RepID=A0A6J4JH91_9PSEU|nr:MAG: Citronellyl-CoA dehydrogenase @ Acyl-CoA dehydrogenase, Mycobacterial subgroup FadE13 [uncultured Actinomycetospora sp.]
MSAHDAWATPERRALRELVAGFTEREIVPHLERWEDDGALPRALHERAGDLGLLELGFPEAAGGAGDHVDALLVAEQLILSGGSSGVCAGLFTHGIGVPHIAAAGDPDQIARFVRPTLAGRAIASLGITEPDTGSDAAAVTTRARREGDEYVVDGAKTFITSGTRADFVTTAVRTGGPGHRGVSLLVIETDRPGVSRSRLRKMGWHCSDTAELRFDGVRVPASNLVGAEGTGFRQIMVNFGAERLSLAVQAYATAQRCVDLTLDWVRSRRTFGEPLARRQVVRHQVAEMAREATVARTYVRDVLARWQAGSPDTDVVTELAMAKNTAVAACDAVVDRAVQLHGGMGYMHGVEVERHYRDARILGIGGGTTEIMNEVVAGRLGLDG